MTLFNASIVRDLDEVPAEFLERIRAHVIARIVETEAPETALPALAVLSKHRPNSSTTSMVD
jgi:hypothetical protein